MPFDVKLPLLDWFLAGNDYSGSLGTDPNSGCLNITTLKYKVKADVPGEKLQVLCYMQLPLFSVTNIQKFKLALFELSDFGREVAENWILRQYYIADCRPESLTLGPAQLPERLDQVWPGSENGG